MKMKMFFLICMLAVVSYGQQLTTLDKGQISAKPTQLSQVNLDIVQLIEDAVVYIEVANDGKEYEWNNCGTGFFINDNGLLITNNHVVNGKLKTETLFEVIEDSGSVDITVVVNSGEENEKRFEAKIIKTWHEKPMVLGSGEEIEIIDLALLKIDYKSKSFLKFVDLSQLGLTYEVWAAGFPLGSDLTLVKDLKTSKTRGPNLAFKSGIISSIRKDEDNNIVIIDHTAPINHGNSGGPLMTPSGYCVGINTWGPAINIYWAIPNELALEKFNEVIELELVAKLGVGESEIKEPEVSYLDEGIYAFQNEDYEKAIDALTTYTDKKPDDWKGFYYLGRAYCEVGEYEVAIAKFSTSIELDSQNASSFNDRGVAWSEAEDYKSAISDYDRAIEMNPDYADAQFNRGIAYYWSGDSKMAKADLEKYLEFDQDNEIAKNLLEEMKK